MCGMVPDFVVETPEHLLDARHRNGGCFLVEEGTKRIKYDVAHQTLPSLSIQLKVNGDLCHRFTDYT
jgi:hypothetical protein